MNINKCKIIEFPNLVEGRENLNYLVIRQNIPFEIKRIFYISNVPLSTCRGDHAHIINHQLIICIKGSLEVIVDDGRRKEIYNLNNSYQALYIPPMIWSKQTYNESDTICLVLASEKYEINDYIEKYEEYLIEMNKLKNEN